MSTFWKGITAGVLGSIFLCTTSPLKADEQVAVEDVLSQMELDWTAGKKIEEIIQDFYSHSLNQTPEENNSSKLDGSLSGTFLLLEHSSRAVAAALWKNNECSEFYEIISNSQLYRHIDIQLVSAIDHEMGHCVEQNYETAAALFKSVLSAEDFNPVALTRLGALYEKGLGVHQDIEQANFLYQRAALHLRPQDLVSPVSDLNDGASDERFTVARHLFQLPDVGELDLSERFLSLIAEKERLYLSDRSLIFEYLSSMEYQSEHDLMNKAFEMAWYKFLAFAHASDIALLHFSQGIMQPDICAFGVKLNWYKSCLAEQSFVIPFLRRIALGGDEMACSLLAAFYNNHINERWAQWGLYALHKASSNCASNQHEDAVALPVFDKAFLDAWLSENSMGYPDDAFRAFFLFN